MRPHGDSAAREMWDRMWDRLAARSDNTSNLLGETPAVGCL